MPKNSAGRIVMTAAWSWKAVLRATRPFFIASLVILRPFPVGSETVPLDRQHGTYRISVQINGALVQPFVLDTGASAVVLPAHVFRTLTRTGTITRNDFIGQGSATLADGSTNSTDLYVLREVRVGNHVVRNVVANVVSVNGDPLLGQTFLSKLPTWSIDNSRQVLVIGKESVARQNWPIAGAYVAIAWDNGTGKSGWSWNQPTPNEALQVALVNCSASRCRVIIHMVAKQCAALATTEGGQVVGAAARDTLGEARVRALAICQEHNAGDCVIRTSDCNK